MHDPARDLAGEWLTRAEHDLNYLIDLCVTLDRDFEQFRAEADELTPYAVEYRYPDALPLLPSEPAQNEFQNRTFCFLVFWDGQILLILEK